MKKLLLLFLPGICFSQDLKIYQDEFNNLKKIECTTQKQNALIITSISKDVNLTLTCYANIEASGNKYTFLSANVSTSQILCYSNYDGKLTFLFEDGSILTLKQISKLKCDTNAIIKYELSDYDLTTLLNNDIKKIRIFTSDAYLEGTIKENKKHLIKDTFVKFKMNLPTQ